MKYDIEDDNGRELTIDSANLQRIEKVKFSESELPYELRIFYKDFPMFNSKSCTEKFIGSFAWECEKDRDKVFDEIQSLLKDINYNQETQKGGSNMFNSIKEWFDKNKDVVITIALVAVIDQIFFDGALRQKIQSMVEKMLTKAEKKLQEK